MRSIFIKTIALIFLLSCTIVEKHLDESDTITQNTYELIMDRFLEQIITDNLDIDLALNLMNDKGEYSDIDYTSTDRVGWSPSKHYCRLKDLAITYINPRSKYYQSIDLYDKIVKGLKFWYDTYPKSSNWWFQWIEEPQMIGITLMALRHGNRGCPKELEDSIIVRWIENGGNPSNEISSNRVNMALHWVYLACLTEDHERLSTALGYIWEQLRYSTGEGFKEDGSFQQHGKQLYIGAYSESLMEGILSVAICVSDTEYALGGEEKEILSRYIRGIYNEVIRGASMHWNCLGRAIAYEGFIKNPEKRASYFNRMAKVDYENAELYITIANRIIGNKSPELGLSIGHKHYYQSDYTTHVRPHYSFSVRLVSSRTCRNENGNGENELTYYLSDGSTCIMTTGNEYVDIMPLWDWNSIPGTTAPLMGRIPVTDAWGVRGSAQLVGGVSDTKYGCTAYSYYDVFDGINTGACKSWFFFDDEIVCLGTGIRSDYDVITAIDQSWGGEYYITSIDNNVYKSGSVEVGRVLEWPQWVLHKDIGYYFPIYQKVKIKNNYKTGSWRDIAISQRDDMLKGKVFSINILHNENVHSTKGDSYAYVVIPGTDKNGMINFAKNNEIEILSNTEMIQAVFHRGLKNCQINFFKEGELLLGKYIIEVDRPCCLIIKEINGKSVIHMADLSYSQAAINIIIKDSQGYENKYISNFSDIGLLGVGMSKELIIPELLLSNQ